MNLPKWPLFAGLCLLAVVGCQQSPADRLVGIWSLDESNVKLPPVPGEEGEGRLRSMMENVRLKLLSDRQFVLVGGASLEGHWTFSNGTVELRPTIGGKPSGPKSIIRAQVGTDGKTMEIVRSTPIGDLKIPLRKTG